MNAEVELDGKVTYETYIYVFQKIGNVQNNFGAVDFRAANVIAKISGALYPNNDRLIKGNGVR